MGPGVRYEEQDSQERLSVQVLRMQGDTKSRWEFWKTLF